MSDLSFLMLANDNLHRVIQAMRENLRDDLLYDSSDYADEEIDDEKLVELGAALNAYAKADAESMALLVERVNHILRPKQDA